MCGKAAVVTAEERDTSGVDNKSTDDTPMDDTPSERSGTVDPRAGLPDDERALLEAFDRLSPQGSVVWNFDDAIRRLSEPDGVPGRPAGWGGLPADLWERGRSTKASERVLGDVVKTVSQDLTEYTDRAVEEGYARSAHEAAELRRAVLDGLRFLAARVERLESSVDPLGLQAGGMVLPPFDASAWTDAVGGWATPRADLAAVVGELGDLTLVAALAGSGSAVEGVEGVDPRGAVVWDAVAASDVGPGGRPVDFVLAEVADHLGSLPDDSRGCVVLAGCLDRGDLVQKVRLIDEAGRVVAPGGTIALLVSDQAAWDASLDPVLRDLLPGRPLHPESWMVLLARRGLGGATWLRPGSGDVHAVVVGVPR